MPTTGRTFLQTINIVLPRLRKPTVAANDTTTYSTMIGTLVNQVKTEIEYSHYWRDLRDTYTVTAVVGTTAYVFTGAGPNAQVLDGWNTTTPIKLKRGTFSDFNDKFFGVKTVATGKTEEYLVSGLNASYDLQIDIWPSPSATNVLKFNLYVPQATLAADSTVVTIPNDVLIEGVVARALTERGDDGGDAAKMQEQIYQRMLALAVANEKVHDPTEVNWEWV